MSEPDAARYLETVFGPEWELQLLTAGLLGATTSDDGFDWCRARVRAMAEERNPNLGEHDLDDVEQAWFEIWCVPVPEEGESR